MSRAVLERFLQSRQRDNGLCSLWVKFREGDISCVQRLPDCSVLETDEWGILARVHEANSSTPYEVAVCWKDLKRVQ